MSGPILAFDLGGTKLTAGTLEASREGVGCTAASVGDLPMASGRPDWVGLKREFSPPGNDADNDVATLFRMGEALLAGRRPAAVGVSFGGPVRAGTGTIIKSDHVPGWDARPLARELADEFGAPAFVDNDANAGALGEYVMGAGAGASSLLYVTVSTGVGGGWVLDGRVWGGVNGLAGEIGHTVVDPAGPLCFCGKRGCAERLASGPYIAQEASERLTRPPGEGGLLRALVEEAGGRVTGELVARAAEAGDGLAAAVMSRAGHALGVAIGNAINLMNPELVVLGGGVAKSGPAFWEPLRAAARGTARDIMDVRIEAAALGDEAPLWGAAALAGFRPVTGDRAGDEHHGTPRRVGA